MRLTLSLFCIFVASRAYSIRVAHHTPEHDKHKDVLAVDAHVTEREREQRQEGKAAQQQAPVESSVKKEEVSGARAADDVEHAAEPVVRSAVAQVVGNQQKVPESGEQEVKKSAAPPTLEDLVNSGSICEKQQIISAFLERQINTGPLREMFDPQKQDSVHLAMCKSVVFNPPKVCKAGNITSQPLCPHGHMNKIVDKYFAYGVCTVEAALNQLYHKHNQSSFIFSEIDALVDLFLSLPFTDFDMRNMFRESESVIRGARSLFYKAETALTSQKVQSVFYKRWELIESLLCGVAAGSDNDIMRSISLNLETYTAEARVDLESYVDYGVEVFLKAYEPLEAMVSAFGGGLLLKSINLDRMDFQMNVRSMAPMLEKIHEAGIKDNLIDELRKLPHDALGSHSIDEIAEKFRNQISLVQNGEDIIATHVKDLSASPSTSESASQSGTRPHQSLNAQITNESKEPPLQIFRKALMNLGMFKYRGDHIVPELDVERVKIMISSALLEVSDEEMVAKLIVKPQAAMRVFYNIIKLLVPLPKPDQINGKGKGNKFGDSFGYNFDFLTKQIEDQFTSVKEKLANTPFSMSKLREDDPKARPEADGVQLSHASMLQLSQKPGVRSEAKAGPKPSDWETGVKSKAQLLLGSYKGKVNLESKVKEYVELQKFQVEKRNLLNISSFMAPGFAGLLGLAIMALYVLV